MSTGLALSIGLVSVVVASDSRQPFEATILDPLANERYNVTADIATITRVSLKEGALSPTATVKTAIQLLRRMSGEFVVCRSIAGRVVVNRRNPAVFDVIGDLPGDRKLAGGKYLVAVNVLVDGRAVATASRVIRLAE